VLGLVATKKNAISTDIRHLHAQSTYVDTAETDNVPHVRGAYPGKNQYFRTKQERKAWEEEVRRPITKEELVELGYHLLRWDGEKSIVLVDQFNRIFAVLFGRPRDPTFLTSVTAVHDKIIAWGKDHQFKDKQEFHRRDGFPVLNFGAHGGGGPKDPYELVHNGADAELLEKIRADRDFQRLAGPQSASYQTWAPRLCNHYRTTLNNVHRPSHLKRNFCNSVFPCMAVNFGGNVWTFQHKDPTNLSYGWCLITAGGPFDHTRGGLVVLDDLKLLIEFPHTCTIGFPQQALLAPTSPSQKGIHASQ